jgi:hypothetical protein
MKFLKYDLGHRERGDIVTVNLSGDSVNVRLMTPSDFSAFKAGRSHQAIGGHVTKSPYRAVIPNSGRWMVVVDRGGYTVNTTVSVNVRRPSSGILPPAMSADPLADIGRNLASAHDDSIAADLVYDVFISHAGEDKDEVARPLHDLLADRELTVWLDEIEMKVGARLRRSIDRAVATSRYAVVVLSPTFFSKQWTQYELDGLVAREMTGEQIILPIWHRLTRDDLLAVSPSLADRIALNTATQTLDDIAAAIADAVREANSGA